jgi:hypothetical protein
MVKVAYNNLDRLVRWQADDFIDFKPDQRRAFDEEFSALWYWHRTTQLPEYASTFSDLARALSDRPVTDAEVEEIAATLTLWGDRLERSALPFATRLLAALDDQQVRQLAVRIREDKGWRDTEADDLDGQRKAWREQLIDRIEGLTGRLTRAQRAIIEQQAPRYQPEQALWEAYIADWQNRFIALLADRRAPDFSERLAALVVTEDYGEPLTGIVEANEALSKALLVAVMATLDARQRTRLSTTLQDLADDFRELAAEAPDYLPKVAAGS